jgi:hypothetical protein
LLSVPRPTKHCQVIEIRKGEVVCKYFFFSLVSLEDIQDEETSFSPALTM